MNEKEKFVTEYLEREKFVDVLDVEFMRSFAMRFACKAFNMNHGAPRVPLASKTLSNMFKGGLLERFVVGVNSYAGGVGFPKWVYSYSLAKPNKAHPTRVGVGIFQIVLLSATVRRLSCKEK